MDPKLVAIFEDLEALPTPSPFKPNSLPQPHGNDFNLLSSLQQKSAQKEVESITDSSESSPLSVFFPLPSLACSLLSPTLKEYQEMKNERNSAIKRADDLQRKLDTALIEIQTLRNFMTIEGNHLIRGPEHHD